MMQGGIQESIEAARGGKHVKDEWHLRARAAFRLGQAVDLDEDVLV